MKKIRNSSFLSSADFTFGIAFDCIFQNRKRIKLSKCVLIHKKGCRDIHQAKLYTLNSNPKFETQTENGASSPNSQSPDSTNSVLFRSVKKETHQIRRIKRHPLRKSALAELCPGRTKRARGLRTVIKSFALRFLRTCRHYGIGFPSPNHSCCSGRSSGYRKRGFVFDRGCIQSQVQHFPAVTKV